MESYDIPSSVSVFFRLTQCFRCPSPGRPVSALHFFLWTSDIPLDECTVFVYLSSVDVCLVCVHILALVAKAAINIHLQGSDSVPVFDSPGRVYT